MGFTILAQMKPPYPLVLDTYRYLLPDNYFRNLPKLDEKYVGTAKVDICTKKLGT